MAQAPERAFHLFTPERIAQLDQISAEIKAGAKTQDLHNGRGPAAFPEEAGRMAVEPRRLSVSLSIRDLASLEEIWEWNGRQR
jgi:hypothetical protein